MTSLVRFDIPKLYDYLVDPDMFTKKIEMLFIEANLSYEACEAISRKILTKCQNLGKITSHINYIIQQTFSNSPVCFSIINSFPQNIEKLKTSSLKTGINEAALKEARLVRYYKPSRHKKIINICIKLGSADALAIKINRYFFNKSTFKKAINLFIQAVSENACFEPKDKFAATSALIVDSLYLLACEKNSFWKSMVKINYLAEKKVARASFYTGYIQECFWRQGDYHAFFKAIDSYYIAKLESYNDPSLSLLFENFKNKSELTHCF